MKMREKKKRHFPFSELSRKYLFHGILAIPRTLVKPLFKWQPTSQPNITQKTKWLKMTLKTNPHPDPFAPVFYNTLTVGPHFL